jgi:hypothetical protein
MPDGIFTQAKVRGTICDYGTTGRRTTGPRAGGASVSQEKAAFEKLHELGHVPP